MMDRPIVQRPRKQEWQNDDEQIATLLDHIEKKVLNVDDWKFRVPHLNKEIRYAEVLENTRQKYPELEWIDVMKNFFIYVPDKFRLIKEDLWTVFKRFTLNLQERLNYIEQMEQYADYLEGEAETLRDQVHLLKEDTNVSRIKAEIERPNNKVDGLLARKEAAPVALPAPPPIQTTKPVTSPPPSAKKAKRQEVKPEEPKEEDKPIESADVDSADAWRDK